MTTLDTTDTAVVEVDAEVLDGNAVRILVRRGPAVLAGRTVPAGGHLDLLEGVDGSTLAEVGRAGTVGPTLRRLTDLVTRAGRAVRSGQVTPVPAHRSQPAHWEERPVADGGPAEPATDRTGAGDADIALRPDAGTVPEPGAVTPRPDPAGADPASAPSPGIDPALAPWYRAHLDALATLAYGPAAVAATVAEVGAPTLASPGWAAAGRRARRERSLWEAQMAARRAAGVRLAVRILPPANVAGNWTFEGCLVQLAEPSLVVAVRDVIDAPGLGRRRKERMETLLHAEMARARGTMWARWNPRRALSVAVDDVADYLDRRAELLADMGITTIAPLELLTGAAVRRSATAARTPRTAPGTGLALGTAAQLALTGKVEIVGEPVSAAQLAAAVAAKRDLLLVGGSWVRVGAAEIQAALAFLRRVAEPVTTAEVLIDPHLADVDIDLGNEAPAWVSAVRDGTWTPADPQPVPSPPGLTATLRPYQEVGLSWLVWCEANELGGILADDMGLGKTVQILAAIEADHHGPTVVVCPPSIVTNWMREAAKFVPNLVVRSFHGANRGHLGTIVEGADIVVTTYDLVRNDATEFAGVQWLRCVLDEAGKIKNPVTKTARAVRAIRARHRFAVTGTPVENHAGELWSLMDFANPGLLGPHRAFMERFNNGALTQEETGDERADQLARGVAPFILRRLKTDPGVADDLPPKTVVRDDCPLTNEQVSAYEAAAAAMLDRVERSGADARRICVIDGIAKLKQICNHPATMINDPDGAIGGRSGKVERLGELLAEIVDEGSAAVVFSQYPTFLARIAAHLDERLGLRSDVLDGKVPRGRRDAMVDRFCDPDGPPVLYSSLKAGGLGLNLVRANHIIHFDLWWNPAAEDQASDRAWRIGQTRPVIVHNLVCPGTLEERIEKLLETKRAIAAKIVGTHDAGSLASLDDHALEALVTLSRPDVITTTGAR